MKPKIKPSGRVAERRQVTAARELHKLKEVEFHTAAYSAWFNTALELDKGILALSAGGIGLLLTLATTKGFGSASEVFLYVAALLSFLISLLAVLRVLRDNKVEIEKALSTSSEKNDSNRLGKLERTAARAFWIGAFFSAVLGIIAGANVVEAKRSVENKDVSSATIEQIKEQKLTTDKSKPGFAQDGFSNLQKISPVVATEKKSFEGIQNIKPTQGQQQTNKTSPPATGTPAKKNE